MSKAPNAALEAIKFALETDEGIEFLRLWLYGEFGAIRRDWPECPSEVFIGAEYGFTVTQEALID
ncbi:hypothetical protein CCU68_32695 [Pseudomonas gingeri NCPPB 3146 = LMG 5327]|uniref:Uncharacterized protein n=2 Tax=Pseudomonas gingeri TaxID=117681 RepID=A0A7Y7Y2F8_9PSED|nr:hypothetical protein [Pseudomonas gingeri]NWC16546.1 hypothetical protein [Pseudomonas gingeri]PNQ88294.1 hypothetical protein CCU68_32695 [Pseudomonas gingeri NCPPB 3146 = LMG 5327]